MRNRKNERRAAIEALLAEAADTLGVAQATRCLPPTLPTPPADRRAPARRALERLSRALILVATAQLTADQRELLWMRARGVSWKQLQHETGIPDATLADRHDDALAVIVQHATASGWRIAI